MELYAKDGQIVDQQTGQTVGLIPYFDADNQNQAQLQTVLAAAPEMLHALQLCRKWFDTHGNDYGIGLPNCFIQAKSAIQKATNP